MILKKIGAGIVLDSRKERTIKVIVKTEKGNFITSAPAGKSKGKYEATSYAKNIELDIGYINNLNIRKLNILNIRKFKDLIKIEKLMNGKIGANTLFAFEASLLKAIAGENGKELWNFLLGEVSSESKDSENSKFAAKYKIKFPRPIGNAIGGGLHSKGKNGKKPDFQEFLFIPKCKTFKQCVRLNDIAYYYCWKLLGYWVKKRNDESAWETGYSNEQILQIMNNVKKIIQRRFRQEIDIGIDCASSGFFKNGFYYYKNPPRKFDEIGQLNYINYLIKKYNLFYVEDPVDEEDFDNFSELNKKNKNKLIVGDDLTVTNPERLKKAIKENSISGIIVKPNQIGSLLKFKEVIDIAKKNKIKTIISHRSGETMDNTIADLCIGFQCDFIKTGIYGDIRKAKLKRIIEIERQVIGDTE